ncbi:MAG: hypothetical protein KIG95_03165 [Comamonas sp.]|nr:hypothetical protein [Comamonas sp.]
MFDYLDGGDVDNDNYQERHEDLLKRLSKALDRKHFYSIENLSFSALSKISSWHEKEQERIKDWFNDESHQSISVDLSSILNSEKPDREKAAKWLDENLGSIDLNVLMQLVADTRVRAVSDSMRAKTEKRVKRTAKKHKVLAWRWLTIEARMNVDKYEDSSRGENPKKYSKNSATPILAEEFNISERHIRNAYLTSVESNKEIFPQGVSEARKNVRLKKFPPEIYDDLINLITQ